MNQTELEADMKLQTAKLTKIGTEVRTLLTKIDELEAAIAEGTVSQGVQDAWAEVKAQHDVVDELAPDAPPA